jgi:hypothetical protein
MAVYPPNNVQAGAQAEQDEINRQGGLPNLDNKINAKK